MFRLIKFLFTGVWHTHRWEIYKEEEIIRESRLNGRKRSIGTMFMLKCYECGEIKSKIITID